MTPDTPTDSRHAADRAVAAMPTAYNPADHEGRIRARWDDSGVFHADPSRVLTGAKPPYCVLIPPPNVTGALHLGHALNNTLQDILVRVHRMKGFEALWMPGTDHAGIATQTVVEKRILSEGGKPRIEWDRDAFVAKVQQWKDEYEARITEQLKLMGCSCDWSRQRFTMDDTCARAVREAFFQLFSAGLIERGKRLVNWDPVTRTALADDEVEMREVEGAFYYLRYPLCDHTGQPAAAVMPDGSVMDHVTVATTRPETYLGDTAVAINPSDPRAPALKSLDVRLPLVGRVIPIIEDSYVVMPDSDGDVKARYATGFLKVTPAHDENDYQIGLRHDLPIINVMAPDATISDKHGWSDTGDAHIFLGLSREDARNKVINEFESRGLLAEVRAPYVHSVGHSYRSHVPIEPYLSDQWYVKVTDDRLAGVAQRALDPSQQTGASKWLQPSPDQTGGTGVPPVSSTPRGTGVPPVSSTPRRTGVPPVSSQDKPEFHHNKPIVDDNFSIHKRKLPHWQKGGSVYFITFRIKSGVLNEAERQLVADACAHWHNQRARIYFIVVMPDHVHLLLTPMEETTGRWWPLQTIIHSIKSFTAHRINERRGATGSVWQTEYFDRIIRDDAEFYDTWRYMANNPVKAGLVGRPEEYVFALSPVLSEDGRDDRPTGAEGVNPGTIRFFPDRYARTYEAWHENIRDWCVSRQLWWGHRIPVWSKTGPAPSELINRAEQSNDTAIVQTSDATHIALRTDEVDLIADIEAAGFRRDPDVLDTWFSSALWPLSTMGWPDAGQDEQFPGLLEAFKPTSVLCTARDIITLWVSRMVMFNTYFTGGRVPFHRVYIHPVIQDGDGKRMSKSAGNGVDPLDIIRTHGADAMRFTLAGLASQTQDVRLPVERDRASGVNSSPKFDLGKRFCNKLWNASRFTMMMLAESAASGTDVSPVHELHEPNTAESRSADAQPTTRRAVQPRELPLIDRWMLSRLTHAVSRIEAALASYEFNIFAETMYDLLWTEFCDWYLEAVKPTVRDNPAQQATLRNSLDIILRLLHPIAPFVTEAIWEQFTSQSSADIGTGVPPVREQPPNYRDDSVAPTSRIKSNLLCVTDWPAPEPTMRDEALEARFSKIQELIRLIRDTRSSVGSAPRKPATLHTTTALAAEIAEFAGVVESLAVLERVTTDEPVGPAVSITFNAHEHRLTGLITETDADAELARLEKSLADLDAAIATLEARLANPGYTERAPANLVQQTRDQLDTKRTERDSIARNLGR